MRAEWPQHVEELSFWAGDDITRATVRQRVLWRRVDRGNRCVPR